MSFVLKLISWPFKIVFGISPFAGIVVSMILVAYLSKSGAEVVAMHREMAAADACAEREKLREDERRQQALDNWRRRENETPSSDDGYSGLHDR